MQIINFKIELDCVNQQPKCFFVLMHKLRDVTSMALPLVITLILLVVTLTDQLLPHLPNQSYH